MSRPLLSPAALIDALLFGGDVRLQAAAWSRLVQLARRVTPDEAEDLAQDWVQMLLEAPRRLAAAQTITSETGLIAALRQHRERLRTASAGLDAHPSPETEQLREAMRKELRAPEFAWSGSGRWRRCRLVAPQRDPSLDDLHLNFDLSASESATRAHSLVSRRRLVDFVRAHLSQRESRSALLQDLVAAAAEAGGHPFPDRRLTNAPVEAGRVGASEQPDLLIDARRCVLRYLRSLPADRRRLRAAALHFGQGQQLEAAAARLGVGKSTVGNETKAFIEGMRTALDTSGAEGGPPTELLVEELETLLTQASLEQLDRLADKGFPESAWNDLVSGRF